MHHQGVPHNKWEANIDWKDAKNELVFRNEYERYN